MTQEEIREQAQALVIERGEIQARHELELFELSTKFKRLQLHCKHPDGYEYSIMGRDTGWRCPDCEKRR